jgi:hypothetical protein
MKPFLNACRSIVPQSARLTARAAAEHALALAMLDVLQRRGRSYGLLAMYEESRLSTSR